MSELDELALEGLSKPGALSAFISPPTPSASARVLAVLLNSGGNKSVPEWPLAARIGVCFVPSGAPLLHHRSAVGNVRRICLLCGIRDLPDSDITQALRLADMPDRRMHEKAFRLRPSDRLAVWLAIHRLRKTRVLVLADPTREMTQPVIDQTVQLLREAAETRCAVVVLTPDARFAAALTDHVTVLRS
jgi:ABC-type branched-subunit amino acid transport system ATPase component